MKILIAEDDSISRRILETTLAKWDYNVISAVDGIEAWEKLQGSDPPELAILDWGMPGMDGLEVCRRLRQNDAVNTTYIIFLTAEEGKNKIIEGFNAGADDYITKPYHSEELRARINVGRRIIELQNKMGEREKLKGMLEMTGKVCHEFNQPLQILSGISELLLLKVSEDDQLYKKICKIKEQVDRMGTITLKLLGISKGET